MRLVLLALGVLLVLGDRPTRAELVRAELNAYYDSAQRRADDFRRKGDARSADSMDRIIVEARRSDLAEIKD